MNPVVAPFELAGLLLQSFGFLVVLTKHPSGTISIQLAAELAVKGIIDLSLCRFIKLNHILRVR